MGTLIVAAISAVVAATVVSRLWQPGTVMATAMTPVLVTLIKEALERPAQRVSSIAGRGAAVPVAPPEREEPPAAIVPYDEHLTPMRVYRPARRVRRRWKLALATGLLAFLIAVAAMTVPELVAGRSVVSAKHDTTIFGGHRSAVTTTKKPQQKKTTTEQQTVTTDKTTTGQTDTQQQTTTTTPTQPAPQAQTQPPAQTQTQPPPATTQPPAQQPPATTP